MRNELSDGKIRIRRYRADDVDALFESVRESIAEASKWLPWCHANYSRDESCEWIGSRDQAWESGVEYDFVIVDVESGLFLGGCGINTVDNLNKRANMGYWVRRGRTGKGIATSAAILAARFGFEDAGLVRLEIVTAVGNRASQRVAEKSAAVREGIARNRLMLQGNPHDAIIFSLIPNDLRLGAG